jgi:hypothetical protein
MEHWIIIYAAFICYVMYGGGGGKQKYIGRHQTLLRDVVVRISTYIV